MNPQVEAFPEQKNYSQRAAELQFFYQEPQFFVGAYEKGGRPTLLLAKPRLKRGEKMPVHRFPSRADPSEYTKPTVVEGEDDILHQWELPDFGELDVGSAKALGQHDSELLLSYLTVPYLRVPLVISFFASDDRIHSLQVPKLQALLEAALFEPGAHLPLASDELEPQDVPSSAPELLGTPHHLLLNELCRAPATLIDGVLKLARQATDLDTGTLKASTTTVILFVCRLCSRIDNYIAFVLAYDAGTHDSIRGKPFRGLKLAAAVRAQLVDAQAELRSVLWGELRPLLTAWYNKLSRELVGCDESTLDANTRHMCLLHSHLVLMLRNISAAELTEAFATSIVCGIAFLATRHTWNKHLLDRWDGAPSYDAWRVPETELYEAVHVLRRKMVHWLRRTATQRQLDAVMNAVVRVSEGSGTLLAPATEIPKRWAYLGGPVNEGRFALQSVRTRAPAADAVEEVLTIEREPEDAMIIDTQVMQLTLQASHPQALKSAVADMFDVKYLFGEVAMQAALTERSAHREVFKLVGRGHSIAMWDMDNKMALLELWRAYYPQELFASEKAWLPEVLEPVRQTYMMLPQPLQLFLPEEPLPEDAQVAYLVGKQPNQSGAWLEIFCYRARRMVHVYRLESHGRRHYRSLVYCSDARYSLRAMQPSTEHRDQAWPRWARHEAGHPYDVPEAGPSAVVTREASVPENLSLGTETFIPARLLYGIVPCALLEGYDFWQDEEDYLRGYHQKKEHADVIFINISKGAHVAFHGRGFERVKSNDLELPPARAHVMRLNTARLERQRKGVSDALGVLEEFCKAHSLLSQPFETSFVTNQGAARILRRLGGHSFGAEADETLAADLARLKELLQLVDLLPFQRRRRRHRVAKVVVPALIDALMAVVEAQPTVAAGQSSERAAQAGAVSASDLEYEELVLLDLLHAPADSFLHSLATVLSRVENLSHVLAWATFNDAAALGAADALTQSDLRIVSLPRLKLTFQALRTGDSVRLYSIDHADLFITNERNNASALLEGIPHSLLLSNSNGEMSVLVPAFPPCRPIIQAVPFSTELVLDRSDGTWFSCLEHPYYVYPVHVSLSFLCTHRT